MIIFNYITLRYRYFNVTSVAASVFWHRAFRRRRRALGQVPRLLVPRLQEAAEHGHAPSRPGLLPAALRHFRDDPEPVEIDGGHGEDYGQEGEAVEEPEHDAEERHLKEDEVGVRVRDREEDEREERRDAAVQDGGPHLRQAGERALLTGAFCNQERVRNVSRVVDAEADDEDDADARDGVDGEAPEVDEA